MSAIAIDAAAVIASLIFIVTYIALGLHHDLPLTGLLDRLPAPPELRLPKLRRPRLAKQGRHHADGLGLVFDERLGLLRHAETGPMPRVQEILP